MSEFTVMLVGDIMLGEPEPDFYFKPTEHLLGAADVAVGHVEVPHTARGSEQQSSIPEQANPPDRLAALANAGFDVATMAGNHVYDAGPAGIEDTRAELLRLGIEPAGAGRDLDQARRPAIVDRSSRVGVLSYNCVGPRLSWATPGKAGGAYVHIIDHYELDYPAPGGPPEIFTAATPPTLRALREDVEALRSRVDVLVVAFHKGIGHVPVTLAMYEPQVAHAAIDAGADIVVGHHAHICKGVEIYRGRPVFHGLGNFVTLTRSLAVEDNPSPERLAWARRRRELFGFEPDARMPTYPFHPESRNTMIATLTIKDGEAMPAFIPCYIDEHARPVPVRRDDGGQAVLDYIRRITDAAGLTTTFEWNDSGDVVLVSD